MHSSRRQESFIRLQEVALEGCEDPKQQPLCLIRDNITSWNILYDAAERAIQLRQYIDEFTDDELADYRSKLARHEARSKVLLQVLHKGTLQKHLHCFKISSSQKIGMSLRPT
jgi:hypothetical protein